LRHIDTGEVSVIELWGVQVALRFYLCEKRPNLDEIMRNEETKAWKWAETQVLGKRGCNSATTDDVPMIPSTK
jgi:hypothetical protein